MADMNDNCRCNHDVSAHRHHRAGTDCSLCAPGECSRFRAAHPIRHLLGRVLPGSRDAQLHERPPTESGIVA